MTGLQVWERYEIRIRNLGPENSFDWLAEIPELDGCRAYGETREAALDALRGVAGAYVRISMEDGDPLPMPLADVTDEYSGRFVVRVTPSLHGSLAHRAHAEGVSMNHLCGELLALGIGTSSALSQAPRGHRRTRKGTGMRNPVSAKADISTQPV